MTEKPLTLTRLELDRVDDLCADLERGEIRPAHRVSGKPLAFLDRPDALAYIRARNNDVIWNSNVVAAQFPHWRQTGCPPAPGYAKRVCIILRRACEKERERRFLRAYLRYRFNPGNLVDDELLERAQKMEKKL